MKLHLKASPELFMLAVGVCAAAGLLTYPITGGDTDLWYHLSAGRWMAEHHAVPREAYFSYFEPARPWADYYWLFQIAAYGAFQTAGWFGLIVLRAALATACLFVLARWMLRAAANRATGAALWGLVVVALMPRLMMPRPHLIELLLLAIVLSALNGAAASLWLVPLSVLWANTHGVSYPVLLLVLAASAVDGAAAGRSARHFVALAACAVGVLVTPLGTSLLPLPFLSPDYSSRHIGELAPLSLDRALGRGLPAGELLSLYAFWLLTALTAGAALRTVLARRPRLGPLVLWVAGLYMLTRHMRLRMECVLLSLPLLMSVPWPAFKQLDERGRRLAAVAGGFALLAALALVFQARPLFPFSQSGLPHGVIAFLKAEGGAGRVLNFPDTGGYWQWEMPQTKIAMDLQTPFLFSDADYKTVLSAFASSAALKGFVSTYHPDFISVPIRHPLFKEAVKAVPEYVLVFFDDHEVLYADRTRHADLVARWALPEGPLTEERLERVLAIDPGIWTILADSARRCAAKGDVDCVMAREKEMRRRYPESF